MVCCLMAPSTCPLTLFSPPCRDAVAAAMKAGMKAITKELSRSLGADAVMRLMLKYQVQCEATATAPYNYSVQVCV